MCHSRPQYFLLKKKKRDLFLSFFLKKKSQPQQVLEAEKRPRLNFARSNKPRRSEQGTTEALTRPPVRLKVSSDERDAGEARRDSSLLGLNPQVFSSPSRPQPSLPDPDLPSTSAGSSPGNDPNRISWGLFLLLSLIFGLCAASFPSRRLLLAPASGLRVLLPGLPRVNPEFWRFFIFRLPA
jgi:hypothetical protein